MDISAAFRKLYHPRRKPAKLIVHGSHAWVPLDMKLTRAETTVAELSPFARPVEQSSRGPANAITPVAQTCPAPTVAPPVLAKPASRAVHPTPPASAEPTQRAVRQAQSQHDFSDCARQPRRTFRDVVGMVDTKQRLLRAALDILEHNDGGDDPRNGILLFGEPGNGKTLFAEALAGELNVPFLSIAFGDTASKWINETPEKLKAVFNTARRTGACVLFIDEIDSFLKPRDGSAQLHSMDRDVVNTMLKEISDLRGSKIVLVAATNFLDQLDPTGIREGRFDFKIEIPPPDLKARIALITLPIVKLLGRDAVDRNTVEALAERWEGFSASRLTALGGQLRELHREGKFSGRVTFNIAMRAMRLLQGRRGRLPENVKPVDEIIMPADSRSVLRDLAYRMREVQRLEQIGGKLPRGLLFYGPPGTGKTQAAMALAKTSGYAFLQIAGADIIAKPESWERLVREAHDVRPVIVFIDEADDVLADRRYSNVAPLTNKILTTLDGASGRIRDVIYIAATNHYDRLDSAALRAGRFGEKIRFDVPAGADLECYISKELRRAAMGRYLLKQGTISRCVAILTGRSIADADGVIAEAVNRAATRALRINIAEIRPSDVVAAARFVLANQSPDARIPRRVPH